VVPPLEVEGAAAAGRGGEGDGGADCADGVVGVGGDGGLLELRGPVEGAVEDEDGGGVGAGEAGAEEEEGAPGGLLVPAEEGRIAVGDEDGLVAVEVGPPREGAGFGG